MDEQERGALPPPAAPAPEASHAAAVEADFDAEVITQRASASSSRERSMDENATPSSKDGSGRGLPKSGGRARSHIACNLCRRQKMRCIPHDDGGPCQRCRHAQVECIFEQTPENKLKEEANTDTRILELERRLMSMEGDRLAALERRLAHVEGELAQLRRQPTASQSGDRWDGAASPVQHSSRLPTPHSSRGSSASRPMSASGEDREQHYRRMIAIPPMSAPPSHRRPTPQSVMVYHPMAQQAYPSPPQTFPALAPADQVLSPPGHRPQPHARHSSLSHLLSGDENWQSSSREESLHRSPPGWHEPPPRQPPESYHLPDEAERPAKMRKTS